MKNIFLIILVFSFIDILYSAELNFGPQRATDQAFRFQHFDTESGKVYEYTNIHYITYQKNGIDYFIEIIEKSKLDGKVFLTKKTWLESKTGRAIRSKEVDTSENITIDSRYSETDIQLSFLVNNKPKKMNISLKENMVPVDLIIFWLRKKIPMLLQGKQLDFILFLPKLAYQLDESPLPIQLSQLDVKATVKKRGLEQIAGRTFETIEIVIKPASIWLKSMLPEDLSTFQFTYMSKPPFTLLGFSEKKIKSKLIEIK